MTPEEREVIKRKYADTVADIEAVLWLGIEAERDWSKLPKPILKLGKKSVSWIAAWLAGEGFHR